MYTFKENDSRLEAFPLLKRIVNESVASFEDYGPLVSAFLNSQELREILRPLVDAVEQGDSKEALKGAFSGDHGVADWRLTRNERVSLGIKRYPQVFSSERLKQDNSDAFLTSYPNDVVLGIFGKGSCKATVYRYSPVENFEVFSYDRYLESRTEYDLRRGETVYLKAGIDALVIEEHHDVFFFELASFEHHTVVWNFNPADGKPCHASSADVSATRINYALEVIRRFNYRDARDSVIALAREHRSHFVRWEAVKTVIAIDEESGIDVLKSALKDPHPHVRNAAQNTLANIEKYYSYVS